MAEAQKVYILSLGCAKNLVDSEMMAGLLEARHWQLTEVPGQAEIIIINTCGFIQAAKEEAIASILEMAQYKEQGSCRLLVAVGCMVEKYQEEMAESLPEVDAFLKASQIGEIAALLEEKSGHKSPDTPLPRDYYLLRRLSTPSYTAYLKIAEGCDNHCSYCLIPQLRGALKSRPHEEVLAEARLLAEKGVKEIVVLAQDTTAYGLDLYGKPSLAPLLRDLAALPFHWIRLLYVYPQRIDEELVEIMAGHKNICPYLDMPIQHIDDGILKAMHRQGGGALIREKIALLKRHIPDIALRTTFMVGFPGEDKAAFANLMDFAREGHFQWAGAFAYCREKDTPAADFPSQKDAAAKERRLDKLMTLLAQKSSENLQRYLGRSLEVLVEGIAEEDEGWYYGRSQYHGPEVDGLVYFTSPARNLEVGEFVKVRIKQADVYDLMGEVEENAAS